MERAAPAPDPAAAPATPGTQRPRRARPAPAVLFQPPEPDRPLPGQPVPAPTGASGGTAGAREAGPAAGVGQASPADSSGEADQPAGAAPTDPGGSSTTQADERAPEGSPQQPAGPPPRTPKARSSRATPARKVAPRKAAGTSAGEVTPATSPAADVAAATPAAAPTKRAARSTAAAATPAKRTATPAKRAASARKSAAPKQAVPAPQQSAEQAPAGQPVPAVVADHPTPDVQPTQGRDAVSVEEAGPAERHSAPASVRTPESELRAITAELRDHPGFAPELLALAAVRALGPGAADWAERMRARYPGAPADGLARLATRRFVRSAGAGGAAAALAGLFAPLAELASVLWTHSNLVLHLAAAYGRDPAHPDRAVELLVLTQVHPDPESARAALAAAGTADDPVEGTWPRAAEAAWRLAAPLTAQAGGWLALRLVSRLLPGAAVLAAALGDSAAADRLAARAVAAYRPSSADGAARRPVRAS
ncbi:hypothetical protein [Micromonospora sp. U21]|uniref:hypothetical protein n=1 Tax=Micromonospora sp. U21 TaxID=2824899 RepID=UPI001FFCA7CF|nr:hypothetical protein [Micromonospora sp. U21]